MNVDVKRTISHDIARPVRPQSNLRQHADNGPTTITLGKGVFVYEKIDLVGHVRSVGKKLLEKCHARAGHLLATEAHGAGLFCGFEPMKSAKMREPFDTALKVGGMMQNFARDHGLYLRAIGDLISFMSPLIIDEDENCIAANRFSGALDDAWEAVRDWI